jgi:hypothetical protein
MRKIIAMILSVCLLFSSIIIIISNKTSSTGTLVADAGPDQAVFEGEIVQFNGSTFQFGSMMNYRR